MRVLTVGVALLAVVGCYGGGGDVQQAGAAGGHDPAVVQRAIDSSLAVFASAISRGDTSTAASIFAQDAMMLPGGSPIVRGRADISQWNAGMFAAFTISNASFTTKDLIVSGDYAIETGEYR
ncbi:MAG: YybH family protein, partial [Gemmatimonadaceae bacterium]